MYSRDVTPATQLTVGNMDPELSWVRAISAERCESPNTNVPRLLGGTVGLEAYRDRLRKYITWTTEDLTAFSAALRAQRVVHERQ